MARTIFITSFHPLISRNILSTSILDILSAENIRVVLIVFGTKKKFFEEEFSKPGIIIEGVEKRLYWQDVFLRYLSLAALKTNSLAIKRKTEMKGSGIWLVKLIGNRKWARKLVRRLNTLITPRDTFAALFDRYKPNLVFATDVQNEFDVKIITEAQSQHIPVVGMVRSWDNLTAKGLIRIHPDKLLVHNLLIQQSAINLHGILEESIEIVGIPHYDSYALANRSSREDFFARIGGDPRKKLIVFAPIGDRYIRDNVVDRDILDILDKHLPLDYQILVRFPPTDTVYELEGRPNTGRIIFDRPSNRFKTLKKIELSSKEDAHLADTLYWSDLVVAGPSTICIDAAFFDKPIILVGFDGYHSRPYHHSVIRYYDYDHFKSILASGGVKLAKNKNEFLSFMNIYLDHPQTDFQGRRKVVKEQCGENIHATERLAKVLLSVI